MLRILRGSAVRPAIASHACPVCVVSMPMKKNSLNPIHAAICASVKGDAQPVGTASPNELKILINNINRELPLGHFNITVSGIQVYFKYVLAISSTNKINDLHLTDVIDMCTFAMKHFKGDFVEFAKKE